jgi:hypothetical protein
MNETPGFQEDPFLDALDRAERTIVELRRPNNPRATRVAALKARLRHGQFHLAIVGQFKRGKSTVLNALLGAAVLPTGVIPLTAIPTFIRWASRPVIHVHYGNGRSTGLFEVSTVEEIRCVLLRFVAEEKNPRNHLGVDRVDLFFPSSFLEGGLILIDTPGIGSSLAHNTRAAKGVLPECDAALFVVSADPPITEAEIAYLDDVCPRVARLMFVLNKIDHFSILELASALSFLTHVLRGQLSLSAAPPIFCLPAMQAFDAKTAGDARPSKRAVFLSLSTTCGSSWRATKRWHFGMPSSRRLERPLRPKRRREVASPSARNADRRSRTTDQVL